MRLLLGMISLGVILAQTPPATVAQEGARPVMKHKNLKLLTDEEIRPAMGAYQKALGVKCAECHVAGDFASDANPNKDKARMMISMTREINAKFTDSKVHVTCYTCHNGATMPKMEAPAAAPPAAN